ncbi:ATP-binding protein [Streptomyces sp. NPDC056296]|uniref:ATP-binding protein n=1 Tax=Streptomyces sp. NPDC056296 TaxID=3345775 RepID=UPI0035DEB8D5
MRTIVVGSNAGHECYVLSGDDGCIAEARRHVAAFLDQAHTRDALLVSARATEVSQLVVSELVTNARKYAPGPVMMELRIDADTVEVIVRDRNPTVPTARAPDPGRIGQHGLEIVKAVTTEFDIQQEIAGKRITARIALPDEGNAAPTGRRQ